MILPYDEWSFLCAVYVPAEDENVSIIQIYLPIPGIKNLSDSMKKTLNDLMPMESVKETIIIKFGKCQKPEHQQDSREMNCDCHCIFVCGYALLKANARDPFNDFDPNTIRDFIYNTLQNDVNPDL